MFTQKMMIDGYYNTIMIIGKIAQKFGNISAREVEQDEMVVTRTSEGVEQSYLATKGQMIVKNLKSIHNESYPMNRDAFEKRYVKVDGDIYKPIGKVFALEITQENLPPGGSFESPLGVEMKCNVGGYLVVPYDKEKIIYYIAKDEFNRTYNFVS